MKDYGEGHRANIAHAYLNKAYNADGIGNEPAFTRYVAAGCYQAGQDSILNIGVIFDRDDVTAGVDELTIDAGMEALDVAREEMRNYVSGVSTDWDDGMIVAFVFKSMLRAERLRAEAM